MAPPMTPMGWPLQVGEADQHVGGGYCLSDVGLFEQIAGGHVDAVIAGADEAVGADERAAQVPRS